MCKKSEMKRLIDNKSENDKSKKIKDNNLKKDFIYIIEPGEEGPCKYIESFCTPLFFDDNYDEYTYEYTEIPDYSVLKTEKKENFLCDWEKNGEYRKKIIEIYKEETNNESKKN